MIKWFLTCTMRTGLTVNIENFVCLIFIGDVCYVENCGEVSSPVGLSQWGDCWHFNMTIWLLCSLHVRTLTNFISRFVIMKHDGHREAGRHSTVTQFYLMISYFRVRNKKVYLSGVEVIPVGNIGCNLGQSTNCHHLPDLPVLRAPVPLLFRSQ